MDNLEEKVTAVSHAIDKLNVCFANIRASAEVLVARLGGDEECTLKMV